MEEKKGFKSFIKKLKNNLRFVIYNENDFQEIVLVRSSRINAFLVGLGLTVVFTFIVYLFIAFTPVRETIPGYPKTSIRKKMEANLMLVDTLQKEIELRDQYFNTINSIISGKKLEEFENSDSDTELSDDVNYDRSFNDSIFDYHSNESGIIGMSLNSSKKLNRNISSLHFFSPVKGIVTNKFNANESHFGTDIVSETSEVVKSTLPGTVTLASWTLETGHIIQIQHANNLVSVYKHNAELLKKVGNRVEAGEPIAIIGNSGELTTGPHLHFELWHNGTPIDPEDYIMF